MLSIMEQPPVDPLPRPTVDGASDAVDASKASSLPGAQEAAVKDSNGAQNGVESISGDADSTSKPSAAAASGGDAGSDVASGDANSDSGVKESLLEPAANGLDPVCSVDTAVTHDPVTKSETDEQSDRDAATISDTKVPSSTAAVSDCDAPIVVPDSDTSAEAVASESLNVSRSELDETREELELRLSGSEGSDPAPEDEDLLLRDDPELVGSPVKAGPVCSSPRPTEDGPKNSTPTPTAGDDTPAADADGKSVDKDEPTGTDQPSEPVSVSPQSPDPSTANPSASSSPSKPSSPASASSKPTSPSKPSSPSQAVADPSAEAGADAVMADTGEVKSSEGDASHAAEADAGDEDEAQSSADPVDLPDDMFESAAALNAAEEEEERVRREAKLLERRRTALLAADSMDSNGDSMDVDDALPPSDVGDATSMDVPDGNDDVTLDVPDEVTLDGPEDGVDPESSMPSSAAGGDDDDPDDPAEVDDGGDAEDTAAGSGGDVDTPDIQLDSEDANDATSNDHEVVLEDAEDSPRPEDSRGAAEDSRGAAEDSRDVSESPAASRKRPPSPLSASEGSKMRRLETPTRPFIAVKKVQLNENNLRILQESQERDRLRLEESAAASAASGSSVSSASPPATAAASASSAAAGATSGAAVNGVKSSLLQRVKQLTREDLETLVLEKMCEAIASRSVIGDMKKSAEKHVVAAERFQKKITHLQKQVGDLHLVVRKLSAELKSRKAPSYPVKITRTVGLQVTLAKSVPPLTSRPRPPPSSPGAPTSGAADAPTSAPTGSPAGAPAGVPVTNGVLRAHLTSTSPIRARQVYSRSPVPQGQVQFRTAQPQSPSHSYRGARRGRPPGVTPSPVSGTTVALVPVVRTMVPIGSVSLPGISSSPQRTVGVAPVSAAAGVPKSPPVYANARGRPAGGHPPRPGASLAAGGGGGAADVVDLTDDDDPKRPTAATGRGTPVTSPRRGGVTSVTPVTRVGAGMTPIRLKHPAPFPVTPPNPAVHTGQLLPPPPLLKVTRRANGIVLSWNMELTSRHATVVSYHLFAYQEAGPVNLRANPWKKVGDVRALPLPMACTLTQFQEGHKYHFAVRAEDSFRRRGPFSNPSSIALIGS